MNGRPGCCEDSRLEVLLTGDAGSELYLQSSAHVESCPHCQQRLTELAGKQEAWQHVGGLLASFSSEDRPSEDDPQIVQRLGVHTYHPIGPHSMAGSPINETAKEKSADDRFDLDGILAAPSHPELLGRLGKYEIERVIGSGGMGIVLRGFDADLNRPVAIKILARHLSHCGAARQRFTRESRAAAAVVHEHVVAIHNVETSGETPFLVMQYVAGESLQARVDRKGPLDTKEVLRIGIQAASGLHAAHEQGVIHRDIKPANILLEHGVDRAMVTDFGLARTVDDASLTQTGIIAGTPHYMSPEQASGCPTDLRTDLFSLGTVLYFMATGRPPFQAEYAMGVLHCICHQPHAPAWQVNPDVPDDLSEIIDRLLEKKPTRRFASAADTQSALTHCLAKIQQRGPRRQSRLVRTWRRNRTVVRATVWGMAALAGLFLLLPSIFSRFQITPLAPEGEKSSSPDRQFAEPQFSLETWQQVSTDEQQQWNQSIREMEQALTQLQTEFPSLDDHSARQWHAHVQEIHNRLKLFQHDIFPQP